MSNLQIYHVCKNFFDYKTVYAAYINAYGDIATTASSINAWNSIPQELVGKTITISCYIKSIDASYIRVQGQVDNAYITGNAINSRQTGYTEITITPVSISDRWRITYGSGTVNVVINQVMVNVGNTRLPYDPYSSEVWHDTPHYIHNTSTDTITTLPAIIYPNDTTATVGLKGNMEQNGTPTPQNPIQPSECGERTANLFDKSQPSTVGFVREDGTINENNNYRISDYIQLLPNTQYTVSNMNVNGLYPAVCFYTDNKTYISGSKYDGATAFTFTTPSNCKYVLVSYLLSLVNNVMLNIGSTALPYEPWGIKIPISSASTTTPVYLGEVETTRKIKKLVLTGDENWSELAAGLYRITVNGYLRIIDIQVGMSSHFGSGYTVGALPSAMRNELAFLVSNSGNNYVYFSPSQYLTLSDFKTYLAQQYAAGTPVTVWYVLATEETAVVNEPLRKIGDYADTVSGITIPTITGKDTFDVDTTLKPSEVELTYTGWHDATVKEWDGSQWQ